MSGPKIFLHNNSQHQTPVDAQLVQRIAEEIAKTENISLGVVNIVLMDSNEHTDLNIKHLGHKYETDILTFDLSDPMHTNTDIYINVDVAKSNAKEYADNEAQEFYRLCIHGMLHMSGYNDHTDVEKKQMTEKEDYYLKFHVKHD